MSAPTKHATPAEDTDRPAKRVRVETAEDEEEDGDATVSSGTQEPLRASDLYLDTVRVACA